MKQKKTEKKKELKRKKKRPIPFGDVLIEKAPGFEIPVVRQDFLVRKETQIFMKTVITPKNKLKYSGEIILTNTILDITPSGESEGGGS